MAVSATSPRPARFPRAGGGRSSSPGFTVGAIDCEARPAVRLVHVGAGDAVLGRARASVDGRVLRAGEGSRQENSGGLRHVTSRRDELAGC